MVGVYCKILRNWSGSERSKFDIRIIKQTSVRMFCQAWCVAELEFFFFNV